MIFHTVLAFIAFVVALVIWGQGQDAFGWVFLWFVICLSNSWWALRAIKNKELW